MFDMRCASAYVTQLADLRSLSACSMHLSRRLLHLELINSVTALGHPAQAVLRSGVNASVATCSCRDLAVFVLFEVALRVDISHTTVCDRTDDIHSSTHTSRPAISRSANPVSHHHDEPPDFLTDSHQ